MSHLFFTVNVPPPHVIDWLERERRAEEERKRERLRLPLPAPEVVRSGSDRGFLG